jgi:hypothetical protein
MPIIEQQSQLALDLYQPINHHELLHQAAHGQVLVWETLSPQKRWTKLAPGDPATQQIVTGFVGRSDTYMSVNEFRGWRRIHLLRSLRCCYVDVDGNTNLDVVLEVLREAKMPMPSFVVFSGRGIHCYWRLEPTHSGRLPLWQRVQDALVGVLGNIGSDDRARDCTRVLRLVGTVNTKNGQEVRGLILTGQAWSLDELANAVLGKPKARVIDFVAAKERKEKQGTRKHTGSIYAWWHLVYLDLRLIARHQWPGGVPESKRNSILFPMAVALSWFTAPDLLLDEIVDVARKVTPTLTRREVEAQMASVLQRAEQAHDGKNGLWHDTKVDLRYRFSAAKLREWLGDSIPADLHDQLRALAPAEVIQKRKQERDAGRWNDHNTGQGYRVGNESKRATARILKSQGASVAAIARELGVTRPTVDRWIAD